MTVPDTDLRPQIALRDYVEQGKWDNWVDAEEAQSRPAEANRREGAAGAYQDVLNFLDGAYRPEYLERVADRIERRRLTGPR